MGRKFDPFEILIYMKPVHGVNKLLGICQRRRERENENVNKCAAIDRVKKNNVFQQRAVHSCALPVCVALAVSVSVRPAPN